MMVNIKLFFQMLIASILLFCMQAHAATVVEKYLPLAVANNTEIPFSIRGTLEAFNIKIQANIPKKVEAYNGAFGTAPMIIFTGPTSVYDKNLVASLVLNFSGYDKNYEQVDCSIVIYPQFNSLGSYTFVFWPVPDTYGVRTRGMCNSSNYRIYAQNYFFSGNHSWIVISRSFAGKFIFATTSG